MTTIKDFLDTVASLRIRWTRAGHTDDKPSKFIRLEYGQRVPGITAIRSTSDCSPLEVVAYFKGGTVSWRGGRTYRPWLLEFPHQLGEAVGLSSEDASSVFVASDNEEFPVNSPLYLLRIALLRVCSLDRCIKCSKALDDPIKELCCPSCLNCKYFNLKTMDRCGEFVGEKKWFCEKHATKASPGKD